ncbi:MAG TPA: protein kinase [Actinomycetota bacterium]|nr:protein kinase [Actinomycetota bacterium]
MTNETVLSGRYRLIEKVAGGGMGTVHRAVDEKLNREVAVKVLAPNLAGDTSFVERFRREALAVAGLAHPNIANVFDYGQDGETHFIVMELAQGRDLSRVLREEGPLSPERVARIVPQICAALGHAHAAGIVHRDVKPGNVIVDEHDRVKVTDFGIARASGESKLTVTGSVLGTAHYISPEQASGVELTPSSDIYSLGIVTYELLTGAVPFTGESLMSVALRHVNDDVPAPSELDPDVPPYLDEIVRRATQKDPKQRFADTEEMAAAFEPTHTVAPAAGATAVLGATEPTIWPIPGDRWDPARLGRRVLIALGALAVVALAFAAWRVATSADEPPAREAATETTDPADAQRDFVIPATVIGIDHRDVAAAFAEDGAEVETDFLAGDELVEFLEANAVDHEDADRDEVVGTDPPPGESFSEEQTITLYVSAGLDDSEGGEDKEDDDERGPPGHVKDKKGKGKDD